MHTQSPPTREASAISVNLLFTMQRELGVLQEGQRAMLAGMERLRIETHQRADRIEQSLWQLQRAPAPSPTTPSRPGVEQLLARSQQIATLAKLALPIVFIVALVTVKILHPDLLPLLRQHLAGL